MLWKKPQYFPSTIKLVYSSLSGKIGDKIQEKIAIIAINIIMIGFIMLTFPVL